MVFDLDGVFNGVTSTAELDLTPEQAAELEELLKDPIWRISNLYYIVDRDGQDILFIPNDQQLKVLRDYYVKGYKRQVILKARQLGMSTLIEIMILDMILWTNLFQACILADTAENAKKLMKTKIKFAYDHVAQDLKRGAGTLTKNQSLMELENGSSVSAGTRQRSGTNQFGHISEWGKIAATDPGRSREVKTGMLPTIPVDGGCIVESTFEGGKGGDFYGLLKRAMETRPEDMTKLDFLFQFFPWFDEPSYTLEGNYGQIDKEHEAYFQKLQDEHGIWLTKGQRLWYYKKHHELGEEIKREFPSTPQECFEAPVEGAIYGPTISAIRAKGQIIDFEHHQDYPLCTYWDKGVEDYCSIWWIQIVGPWIYWVDHFRLYGEGAPFYVNILNNKPWNVAMNFLPHDCGARSANDALSFKEKLEQAGLKNIHLLPRTGSIWEGINTLQGLLKKSFFHKTRCATDVNQLGEEIPSGVTCLESYRRKWLEKENMWHHEPIHDWSSHDSDAARTFAEAYSLGLIPSDALIPSEYREKKPLLSGLAKSAYDNSKTGRKRYQGMKRTR